MVKLGLLVHLFYLILPAVVAATTWHKICNIRFAVATTADMYHGTG
jgi:hypothetical protein